jgi:hypothetical protein
MSDVSVSLLIYYIFKFVCATTRLIRLKVKLVAFFLSFLLPYATTVASNSSPHMRV